MKVKLYLHLFILALKLEGVIGKDISEKDSKLIEILKSMVFNDKVPKKTLL